MINEIYNQLKTPKSIEEINIRFAEIGLKWNTEQIELFLELDKKINYTSGKWSIDEGDLNTKVKAFLDDIFNNKPVIPINLILKDIPFTIGKPEFIKIIEDSHNYYIHPNGAVVCKR